VLSKKILIVEDEGTFAQDLVNRLKKFGSNVLAVTTSGEDAIHMASEVQPDLVVMDFRLQGDIEGVKTARVIRQRFNVPIIYLTSNTDDSTLERVCMSQLLGYILNPFQENELDGAIELPLNGHLLNNQLNNQQWLLRVIESISDGVIVTNYQESIIFMNPAAEQLTGWKQEEARGKNLSEVVKIIDEETRQSRKIILETALQEGLQISLPKETILIAKNGTETPISNLVLPIKNDSASTSGAVLIVRDLTDFKLAREVSQKQIEQEQILAQLSQLNQLKDEYLNTVSHELRAPLSNIKMAIQILQSTGIAEKGKIYLDILKAECDRELALINDLLDLQRVETATTPQFHPESLELQTWLLSIVDGFYVSTHQRQQTLKLEVPPHIPSLVSDSISLARVLAELLNNACKYTPAGGEIVLSVSHQPCSPPTTIFTVSNSTEIPAANLPLIFEKFYRVPKADIWKQGGTGLGLALVQKLVSQLQGTITVESTGGWTTFTVKLTDLVITA
jgi:PAS domain S-box-containing protein